MIIDSIGPNSRPFQCACPTHALREEDAFMQLHGGRASRLIYLIVVSVEAFVRMPGRVLTQPRDRRDRAGSKCLQPCSQQASASTTASAPAG